jgi:DNA-binding transcriptional regulator YdaS (Cro superfamily)
MDEAMREAIAAAGGLRALSRALGTSYQAISQWKRCPAPRVIEVERLTGVSRHKLRPDVFPWEKEEGKEVDARVCDDSGRVLLLEVKKRGPFKDGEATAQAQSHMRRAVQRAASRTLFSMLAQDPDLMNRRAVFIAEKKLANLLIEELEKLAFWKEVLDAPIRETSKDPHEDASLNARPASSGAGEPPSKPAS